MDTTVGIKRTTVVGFVNYTSHSTTQTLHILAKDAMKKNGHLNKQDVFTYFAELNLPSSSITYSPLFDKGGYMYVELK